MRYISSYLATAKIRPLALAQEALALHDLGGELDEEHGAAGPHLAFFLLADAVGRDARGEAGAVADALDDPRDVGGAVELAHVARDADVAVHERLVVDDHVLVGFGGIGRLLEAVGRLPEEMLPHVDLDEVQQRDDVEGPCLGARGFAVEEEVEEF